MDPGRGRAVIAVQEIIQGGFEVEIGIPQKPGQKPAFQLRKLVAGGGVGLLEMLMDAVSGKEPDIGLEDVQVGKRRNLVGEVDRVVPEIDVFGDLAPIGEVSQKRPALGILGDGPAAVELDRAEHDLDIRGRLGFLGGRPRILVGQGGNGLVREGRGHGVDEADDRPGRRAFLFDDFGTGRASAIGGIVVLADRPQFPVRLGGHFRPQL